MSSTTDVDAVVSLVDEKLSMQLDSISWNKKFDFLAVGAYMIDPNDSSKRVGKIFLIHLKLLKLNDEAEGDNRVEHSVEQEIDIDGVLDLRWEPINQKKLAVATSGSFELYELSEDKSRLELCRRLELSSMALYTQWMNPNELIFSDSLGVINIVEAEANTFEIRKSIKVHDNLTWVVQYSPANGLVFAGSDEGKFTGFRLENMQDEEKHYTKKFEVGVTSIIFLEDNVLAIGSYDDTLRIFSIDCVDPIWLSLKRKIEFGGAVWRTIAFSSKSSMGNESGMNYYIVAACARNGIHIGYLNRSTWMYEKLSSCMNYEGFLAYGLDVKMEEAEQGPASFTVASCYFDNNQLHVWKYNLAEKPVK